MYIREPFEHWEKSNTLLQEENLGMKYSRIYSESVGSGPEKCGPEFSGPLAGFWSSIIRNVVLAAIL